MLISKKRGEYLRRSANDKSSRKDNQAWLKHAKKREEIANGRLLVDSISKPDGLSLTLGAWDRR
jgi:hypothetical protein